MADKACVPLPYNIKADDNGLSLRIEFDAHYLSDDEISAIRCHIKALRELVRDVVLLAGIEGCDVTGMQIHMHGGDWRTVRERMEELGV